MITSIKKHWILLLILTVGVLFRAYGINWGLPFGYDPDEPFQVGIVTSMVINGDVNPHWFGHPGTVAFYLLALVFSFSYWIFSSCGGLELAHSFSDATIIYPSFFLLIGRVTLTSLGVASVGVLYCVSERIFNKNTALLAAFFLALSPVHVFYGKLIRPDIIVTFFILIVFYMTLRIIDTRKTRYYVLAGIFSGVALATKYTGVLIAALPIVAFLLTEPLKSYKKIVGAMIAGVIGAFVASPYLFLDWRTAKYNLIREARPRHLSATGDGFLNDMWWYISSPLIDSVTIIGGLGVLIAIIVCFRSSSIKKKIVPIFPILFTIFISLLSLRWERWFVPAIPFYAILAAYGLYELSDFMKQRMAHGMYRVGSGVVLFVICTSLLYANILQGILLTGPDTRDIGQEWIKQNIPEGSLVAIEKYTPYLPKNRYRFFTTDERSNTLYEIPDSSKTFGAHLAPPFARLGKLSNITDLNSAGIEYVILSNWYDRYKAEETFYPEIVAHYEDIIGNAVLVHSIEGSPIVEDSRMLYPMRGPQIRIYKLN